MKGCIFSLLLAVLSTSYAQEFPRGHVFSVMIGQWMIVVTFESDRDLLYILATSPGHWLHAFVPYELAEPEDESIPVHLLWVNPGASATSYTNFASFLRDNGLLDPDLTAEEPFHTIYLAEDDNGDDVLDISELVPGLASLPVAPISTDVRHALNLGFVDMFCAIQSRYHPERSLLEKSV